MTVSNSKYNQSTNCMVERPEDAIMMYIGKQLVVTWQNNDMAIFITEDTTGYLLLYNEKKIDATYWMGR